MLTKPQADFLLKVTRKGLVSGTNRAERRVALNLVDKGFLEQSRSGDVFSNTVAGLEALADYWMRKDAAYGCMAYQLTRQEVEEALAKRLPAERPQKGDKPDKAPPHSESPAETVGAGDLVQAYIDDHPHLKPYVEERRRERRRKGRTSLAERILECFR